MEMMEDILRKLEERFLPYLILPSNYFWMLPQHPTASELDAMVLKGEFPSTFLYVGGFLFAIIFNIIRAFLQPYILKSIATYAMDIKKVPESNVEFPEALKKVIDETRYPTSKEHLISMSKKYKVDVDAIGLEIWRRKKIDVDEKRITKFVEALWRFLLYFLFVCTGLYCLFIERGTVSWWWDFSQFWSEYPTSFPKMPTSTKLYYMIEFGAYLHQMMWTEVSRSDAVVMIIHHIATLLLMTVSYLPNFWKIGSIVMFIHDIADIFLESGKCFNYMAQAKKFKNWAQPITDMFFLIFTILFFVTRILYFPQLLYSWVFVSPRHTGWIPLYPYNVCFMTTLQILHIYWFYLICRMLYKIIIVGKVEKDEREEDEEDIGDYTSIIGEENQVNSEKTKVS